MEASAEVKKLNKDLSSAKIQLTDEKFKADEELSSGDLSVEMLINGLKRVEKSINWTKISKRTRSSKQIKNSSDLQKFVEKLTKMTTEFSDREKDLTIKEYDIEAKMLRCSILEREVELLKKSSVSMTNYHPENIIPLAKGRAPSYVSSNKKYIMPLGSNSKANRPSTNLADTLLGKRKVMTSEDLEESILKDNSNHNRGTFNTPTKMKNIEDIKKVYSGLKENGFDADNYDYNAATPKKKLKL